MASFEVGIPTLRAPGRKLARSPASSCGRKVVPLLISQHDRFAGFNALRRQALPWQPATLQKTRFDRLCDKGTATNPSITVANSPKDGRQRLARRLGRHLGHVHLGEAHPGPLHRLHPPVDRPPRVAIHRVDAEPASAPEAAQWGGEGWRGADVAREPKAVGDGGYRLWVSRDAGCSEV